MPALPFGARSHPEAKWHASLRVRLAIAIAVSVAITGVGAGWLALRLARQALTEEVVGIARLTAQRAVADFAGLSRATDTRALTEGLLKLDADVSEVEIITIIEAINGQAQVIATTANTATAIDNTLGLQAIQDGRAVTMARAGAIQVAAPVSRADGSMAAVVVQADLAGIIALQQRAVRAVLGFAALTIIALVVLMDLLAWPLVYRPIQQLRDTIARVAGGDLSARAEVVSRDELGAVAAGLNDMLERLENFNQDMQARVRQATNEVETRNQELVDSYNRLFGLREQLASAEQLASVGQTAANVAHQVGTPLNLISGYVQLLREELGPDSPHLGRLAIIEEQIAKVTTTVRTLLDRSRQMARKTRTTAGELVSRVIEVMRPNLHAAHIRHEMHLEGGDTPILVDATNFELALLNLMTNAVDAMPNGGVLRVQVASTAGNRVRIEVSDTGHGIPTDLMTRIFEPWVSTKKPGRGTGLGLPIARDVVSAHGGTITVSSTEGAGTTFTIELPSDAARTSGRVASVAS
jgi:two-component system NtrC family sensor kinase